MEILNHSHATASELFGNNGQGQGEIRNVNQGQGEIKSESKLKDYKKINLDYNLDNKSLNASELRKIQANRVEAIADKLVELFGEPNSKNYFLKCGWHLSEAQIWDIAERATTSPSVDSPIRYFCAGTSVLLRRLA